MSDIAYRLLVDMSAKGSLAPQLGQMEQRAKGLDTTFKGLGKNFVGGVASYVSSISSAIEQLGDKAVSIGVGVGALGSAALGAGVMHGIALNDQLEKAQVGLAAIFNAQGVSSNMTNGMQVATAALERMRVHARDLPGELKDLQQIFKLGLTPGLQIGGTVGQLERMSANAMAAGATMELPMDQVARELAQLYSGHAGGHNVFGQMLSFQGDAAKKLNAATGEERLKQIEAALKKYEGSIPVFAKTFEALTSTLKDSGEQALKRATKPTFDAVKVQLDRANRWFSENEGSVGYWADEVGRRLERAFDAGRRKVEQWGPAIFTFASNAEDRLEGLWQKASPLASRLEGLTLGALQDPATLDRIGDVAKLYGAIKVGGAAAPFVKPIGAALTSDAAIGALGGFGPAAAGVALLAVAAEGAAHALTDTTSSFHELAKNEAKKIEERTKSAGDSFSKLGAALQPVADALGTYLLYELDQWADRLRGASVIVGFFADKIGEAQAALYNPWGLKDTTPEAVDHDFDYRPSVRAMGQSIVDSLDLDAKKTKTVTPPTPHVHIGKVEIVVTSNQDPSRIARLTRDRLLEVPRKATTSATTRNWSSERP